MTITIKFYDNIKHIFNSFEEILKLDNYNGINFINCSYSKLSSLPELPNSLIELYCSYNSLSNLPELPNPLITLASSSNDLSSLPELPNSLINLICNNNNLSSLPELPNSLRILDLATNNLSSLPELPNSLTNLDYYDNPIYNHIKLYFNNEREIYYKHHTNVKRLFANKIGNWYLDCKYNPKYKYCRIRLMKEYEELYN
jgi:Leucine-rich repeat (LRR) protein